MPNHRQAMRALGNADCRTACSSTHGPSIMERTLTAEERDWLNRLDTDAPTKPEPPAHVTAKLVEYGLAIELVEGGLQLTTLGREALTTASGLREGSDSR
jgi:hypothetical protein